MQSRKALFEMSWNAFDEFISVRNRVISALISIAIIRKNHRGAGLGKMEAGRE